MNMHASRLIALLALAGWVPALACSDSGDDDTSRMRTADDDTDDDDTADDDSSPPASSGDDDAPSNPDLPAVRELATELASAQCQIAEECFGPFLKVLLRGADCVTYFERVAQDEGLNETERAVDEGRVVYHPERVQACRDALLAVGCSQDNPELPECEGVFEGSVPLGGECLIREECEGEATCVVENACPGTCGALRLAGDPCLEDGDCRAGLVCSEVTARCVAPVGESSPCGGGVEPDCAAGLMCVGDDEDAGTAGTCRPIDELFAGDVGASCDFATTLCATGLSCVVTGSDPDGNLVTECAPPVAAGAACSVGIPTQCPDGHGCTALVELGLFDGNCEPLPQAGEPCAAPVEGATCGAYAVCNDDAQCVALSRLGEPCESDDTCYSGRCDGGACVSQAACRE